MLWVEMMIGAFSLCGRRMSLSNIFQWTAALLSISVEKKNAASYSPHPSPLSPSSSSAVTAGHQGDHDARPHPLVIPSLAASTSREWSVFLRMCRLQRGLLNEGSFSLMNIVTQLPVKWVTSCTQTVPLLSTSVPPPRRCDYVTGTIVI